MNTQGRLAERGYIFLLTRLVYTEPAKHLWPTDEVLRYSIYKCWRTDCSNQIIKDTQKKWVTISSMHINFCELLMSGPCNKSIWASIWVAKGPFKNLNLKVISSKKKRTQQKPQSWKMCTCFTNQNGKINADTSTEKLLFPIFFPQSIFWKAMQSSGVRKILWNSVLIPGLPRIIIIVSKPLSLQVSAST